MNEILAPRCTLKVLLLALSLVTFASANVGPTGRVKPLQLTSAPRPHPKGKWYMARDGHAVYCYGPVRILGSWDSGIDRYATICRGGVALIRLRD
jgi:hypothetical protein